MGASVGIEIARDFAQARDEDDLAKAKNDFLILKSQQDNILTREPDRAEKYQELPTNYRSAMTEGTSLIAANISNPDLRAQFLSDAEVDTERGFQKMQGAAAGIHKDVEVAGINESIDAHMKTVPTADPEDLPNIFGAVKSRLASAAKLGYVSHQEAQSITAKFRTDATLTRIQALPPEARLAATKAPWAVEHIAADTLLKIKTLAEDEVAAQQAVAVAHELFASDESMTPKEADAKLWKKYQNQPNGPDRYKAAKREFDLLHQNNEVHLATKARESYTKGFEAVRAGMSTTSLQAHFRDVWGDMSVDQRKDLINWEANKAAGIVRVHSDRDILMKLKVLEAQGDQGLQMYKFFTDNQGKLNQTDFDRWSSKAAVGLVGDKIDPLVSVTQRIQLTTSSWDDDDRLQLIDGVTDRYFRFTEDKRRNPTAPEIDVMLKESMESHEVKRTWWANSTYKTYSMDERQKVEVMLTKADERQMFAFAAQYDRPTETKLLLEMYRNLHGDLYKEGLDTYAGGSYTPTPSELLRVIMFKAQERERVQSQR